MYIEMSLHQLTISTYFFQKLHDEIWKKVIFYLSMVQKSKVARWAILAA